MHIESPVPARRARAPRKRAGRGCGRAEEVRRPRPGAPRGPAGRPAALAHAPVDRPHMVQSLQTAATCTTIVEADMTRVEAARRRPASRYLPYVARATIETLREFPQLNATLEGETYTDLRRRAPRHRRLARRGRPDRAGHPRRAGALASRAWPSGSRTSPRRARDEPAHAGRGPRRHVHDHQPRRLRLDHGHAGDQPAAGRRSSTPRRSSSGPVVVTDELGNDSIAIRSHDLPVHGLGPPRARRRARRAVPVRAAQEAGDLADQRGRSDGHPAGLARRPAGQTPYHPRHAICSSATSAASPTRGRRAPGAPARARPGRRARRAAAAARAPARLHARPPLGRRATCRCGEDWYRAQGIDVVEHRRAAAS